MKSTDMNGIHAKQALTPDGWRSNVRLTIANGRIATMQPDCATEPGDERHDTLVPAMPNVHSHAFQRGMAGLAEVRGATADSFWSWRTTMYRFALSMTPDQVHAVAAQLYMEMLESGFSRVGEFHYLHHDHDGHAYADIAEMAVSIDAAAQETGIGLTLLPVFYAHSTFGGAAPGTDQRRFINTLDSFSRLMDRCDAIAAARPGVNVGIAPHSLRAVTPPQLEALHAMANGNPFHIHVAEQVKEVEDCVAWSGARPVEWLLNNTAIDHTWCLIHATHMSHAETDGVARAKAVAGLCPITEANLGDGTFPAERFLEAGGAFGIGSDSNILIGIDDELRQLEYSQRLLHRARNVIAQAGGSTGRMLLERAMSGGGQSLAVETGLSIDKPASFLSLKPHYDLALDGDRILDSWLFAKGAAPDCVWVDGVKQVEGGRHHARKAISERFARTMRDLVG